MRPRSFEIPAEPSERTMTAIEPDFLATGFEAERARLRRLAHRILGSAAEAEDAVQDAALRLREADARGIDDPRAWLTTVVSRIALDMLRVRKRRQEDALDVEQGQPALQRQAGATLEEETMLAESVGLAIQVVLDRLEPVARVALVLHDCFGFGFDDIARILDCSSAAARQAASRARRRITGPDAVTTKRSTRQRELVQAFYAASRDGNLQPLLDVLDPQVRLTVGSSSAADAVALDMRGAEAVARQARAGARQGAALVCIDGDAGLVVMAGARLVRALTFVVQGRRIVGIHVVNAPSRLARLELSLLADQWPPPADQESRNRLLDNGPQNRVDVRAPGR